MTRGQQSGVRFPKDNRDNERIQRFWDQKLFTETNVACCYLDYEYNKHKDATKFQEQSVKQNVVILNTFLCVAYIIIKHGILELESPPERNGSQVTEV